MAALYLTVAGEPLYCAVVGGALVGAMACTYLPLLLPAPAYRALDAYFSWVEERGRLAEAEDRAEDLAARDRARAQKRTEKETRAEEAERMLLASGGEGGEPTSFAHWEKWGMPRARKFSRALRLSRAGASWD